MCVHSGRGVLWLHSGREVLCVCAAAFLGARSPLVLNPKLSNLERREVAYVFTPLSHSTPHSLTTTSSHINHSSITHHTSHSPLTCIKPLSLRVSKHLTRHTSLTQHTYLTHHKSPTHITLTSLITSHPHTSLSSHKQWCEWHHTITPCMSCMTFNPHSPGYVGG